MLRNQYMYIIYTYSINTKKLTLLSWRISLLLEVWQSYDDGCTFVNKGLVNFVDILYINKAGFEIRLLYITVASKNNLQ